MYILYYPTLSVFNVIRVGQRPGAIIFYYKCERSANFLKMFSEIMLPTNMWYISLKRYFYRVFACFCFIEIYVEITEKSKVKNLSF